MWWSQGGPIKTDLDLECLIPQGSSDKVPGAPQAEGGYHPVLGPYPTPPPAFFTMEQSRKLLQGPTIPIDLHVGDLNSL